jgi:hypothetical protein
MQFISDFNPGKEVATKYSSYTKAFIIEEQDESIETLGDGDDRTLKKVYNIAVETYLPQPQFMITNTGSIEQAFIETYLDEAE